MRSSVDSRLAEVHPRNAKAADPRPEPGWT